MHPYDIEHGAPSRASQGGVEDATRLLASLFRNFEGSIAFRLWNGDRVQLGKAADRQAMPRFLLVCRSPQVVRELVLSRDPLRLAEAYFRGDVEVEGDFFSAVAIKDQLRSLRLSARDLPGALLAAVRLRTWAAHDASPAAGLPRGNHVRSHSRNENRDAIAFHYDVSNDFYALWLDRAMVYSCAYFEHADDTIDQAQQAKLDHICAKLMLRPGESLLDIGCGWGALIMHAARHYGVRAHGITLSRRQLELASRRILEAGLQDQVTIELRDYRDLAGECIYDKIASVGMFEHIGLNNLPVYFSTVHRLLKPSGLFLNHGITHDVEGWEPTLSTEFINRYVFPDGQLDSIGNIQRRMERARFEIADVEALRPHYALTLRHWVARLEQRRAEALQHVSEATYRVWRLYMAACALEFESGELGVYQVLASKRAGVPAALPMTRRHLYERAASRERPA